MGVLPDVAKTSSDIVIVSDEVQARAIDTDDALASRGKAAAIAGNLVSQQSERRPISGRENHRIERSFRAVDETHSVGRELRHSGGQLNTSGLDGIRQVKPNQRDSCAR